jgi:hypothetical protein
MKSFLTVNTAKMEKSAEYGYLSAILNLQPTMRIPKNDLGLGIKNTCPDAGKCARSCLQYTGRNRFDSAAVSRIRKTRMLFESPADFQHYLDADLVRLSARAHKKGLGFTARLNGISDIPWELIEHHGRNVFERHPTIQFVDYTKTAARLKLGIRNYCLVYSYNEKSSDKEVRNFLVHGGKVAMVFNGELPESVKIGRNRFQVVDGDEHDLVHLHEPGVVLGLRYKRAYSPNTGKSMAVKNNGFILGE